MSISPIGGPSAPQAHQPGASASKESREAPGVQDHDGDLDGKAKKAAAPKAAANGPHVNLKA